jgi:hypothetical protein
MEIQFSDHRVSTAKLSNSILDEFYNDIKPENTQYMNTKRITHNAKGIYLILYLNSQSNSLSNSLSNITI